MKSLLINILLITAFQSVDAQQTSTRGIVADSDHQPLTGATVKILGTSTGTITDQDGKFMLQTTINDMLVVSFVGYNTDTVQVSGDIMHIVLSENPRELGEVVIKSGSTFFDDLDPLYNQIITEKELLKAACCNLSESFETNASVDVSLTDAISGAKMIRMLGLDGSYVLINRENIPHVRGLTGRYGLGFVPGTWIQSIDVGKGAGTVVNGYESMTGQINLELKKPESGEKLYLNGYVNSFGRAELNANHSRDVRDQWTTALLVHADYFHQEVDHNNDGFMDLPKSRQFNVMNKWKYNGDHIVGQWGVQLMRDEKAGGQRGFEFGDDLGTSPIYGFANNTTRLELFGKTGILFLEEPHKGWGFIYSGSYQEIDGGFGRNTYLGKETTLYANVIHQNIIGSSIHQYKTGVNFLFDGFREVYSDSVFNRQEIVPGTFFEYALIPSDRFSLISGFRTDFHNIYGIYWTPRFHLKYQLRPNITFRASAGKGYRTPNVIVENSQVLISSRKLVINEDPKPEISWNMGGSLVTEIPLGGKKLGLVADYFYTTFERKLVVDLDQNSAEINVYNLKGDAFAHSFQIEGSYEVMESLSMKAAYKRYNTQSTINGRLRQVPFSARDRFFFNMGYSTKYEKWTADATLQWYGSKRLPNTSDKPIEFQKDPYSPDFILVNAQVSRGFRWGNIYLGSENLLGFTQDDPIIDPGNPFGNQFDASIVWAPVMGRMIYAGFRYKIKRD